MDLGRRVFYSRREGCTEIQGIHPPANFRETTAGNLNFNDELLALDTEVADYVIVHELLHFFIPNHGKLWKSLMRAHLGDYEQVEVRLQGALTRSLP
jgi:hypothetical protein